MSSFVIKIIAIVTMTIDHVNDVFFKVQLLNIIGRIAFPLFCFQIVVGYSKTSNLKKYLSRLFVFAIISQIPYYFFMQKLQESFSTNVIFTLAFGVLAMFIYDIEIENKNGYVQLIDGRENKIIKKLKIQYNNSIQVISLVIKYILLIILMHISSILKFDYSAWGIILILIIHIFYPFDGSIKLTNRIVEKSKKTSIIMFLAIMLVMSIIKYVEFMDDLSSVTFLKYIIFTFLPCIVMTMFNGKKGKSMKYFFYVYYPLHFVIILLLYQII